MVKNMNDIYKEVDDLFNDFKNTELYKNYISCKSKIESNKEIMDLIDNIKRYKKIYVNKKDVKVKEELDKLYDKLNRYPIYQSYLIYKDEINDYLIKLSCRFNKYFKDILELE